MSSKHLVGWLAIGLVFFVGSFASSPAEAFRSTTQESFTDPDYVGYRLRNVVLLVVADDMEVRSAIEGSLQKKLSKLGVKVFRYSDLFPPTRIWSDKDILAIYEKENIESGLVVAAGASSSSLIPFATQTYSSGNVWGSYNPGSGSLSAHGSGNSTSVTLHKAKSRASFSALVMDVRANRVVWKSDVFTKARGTLFVGIKKDARGGAKAVVDGLIEKGHVAGGG